MITTSFEEAINQAPAKISPLLIIDARAAETLFETQQYDRSCKIKTTLLRFRRICHLEKLFCGASGNNRRQSLQREKFLLTFAFQILSP
jgi:hypothetical protein